MSAVLTLFRSVCDFVFEVAGLMIAAELALHRYCVVDSANSDRRRRGHHCVLRYFTAGYPETAKLSKDLLKLNETGKDAMRRLLQVEACGRETES